MARKKFPGRMNRKFPAAKVTLHYGKNFEELADKSAESGFCQADFSGYTPTQVSVAGDQAIGDQERAKLDALAEFLGIEK